MAAENSDPSLLLLIPHLSVAGPARQREEDDVVLRTGGGEGNCAVLEVLGSIKDGTGQADVPVPMPGDAQLSPCRVGTDRTGQTQPLGIRTAQGFPLFPAGEGPTQT